MIQPTLYSFRRCPYAIRARLALQCAQTPFNLIEVVLRDKPAALLSLSPKGTVPVLHLPDGQVLAQSLDIMRWALRQHDPQGWLTQAPQADMQALIDINDGPFKHLLDRYKYADRHPQMPRSAYRDEASKLLLAPLNERLQQHAFLFGAQASLADMAIVPFIRQFAQVDPAWLASAPWQPLNTWLHHLVESHLFKQVMAKP